MGREYQSTQHFQAGKQTLKSDTRCSKGEACLDPECGAQLKSCSVCQPPMLVGTVWLSPAHSSMLPQVLNGRVPVLLLQNHELGPNSELDICRDGRMYARRTPRNDGKWGDVVNTGKKHHPHLPISSLENTQSYLSLIEDQNIIISGMRRSYPKENVRWY